MLRTTNTINRVTIKQSSTTKILRTNPSILSFIPLQQKQQHTYLHTSQSLYANGGKSPLDVFRETFKQEWNQSKELQDNIKQLQDASGRLADNETLKKAREATQRSSTILSKTLKKTGEKLDSVATKAWDSEVGKGTRKIVNATAETIDENVIEPVKNTKVYKEVSSTLSDGSSTAYGGFLTKEEREFKRQEALRNRKMATKSNEDAGTALVATDIESKQDFTKKLQDFQTKTTVGRGLHHFKIKFWDESENPLIVLLRTIKNKVSGFFFAETEASKVMGQFHLMDPTFNLEDFNKYLREFVVPEVLEAYIKGDEKVLKTWFSEAPFNVYSAQKKFYTQQGLFSDGRILDIRGVEIVSAKMLPADIPVLVVGCRAQEIHLYRNVKTGEIAAGTESNIMLSSYAMVLTRDPEHVDDKLTEGWKIMEFVRGGSRSFT
ncbi:probable Mitochondrial import inner membrane translocase subunit TIM44 [Saccharomycodes ludwigii]|uniref:Mitochondrial import inner membrane translocase subunit TIM44 n=1 Tax=Saccharomycodes ludwigii TaxID=36035 RepID=A0A376BA90_9ASCO|nr:probable Mitochondrial import inner membrane translocase subunit TIM44 [Saccharomycodes ludwigii]